MHDYLKMLSDPQIFSVNEQPPRSDHANDPDSHTLAKRISLNGEWQILYFGSFKEALARFPDASGGIPSAAANTVAVPGNLQLAGYGAPQYTGMVYPWEGREELSPGGLPKSDPTAIYSRSFSLTAEEAARRARLRFEGVESCVFLFVNGVFAGYAEDSFTPAEFDITPFLRPGENTVTAAVAQFCTGSWLEDQDFWRLSGIFRDVTLLLLPGACIEDIDARPLLSASLTDASVSLRLTVSCERPHAARIVAGLDGNIVYEAPVSLLPGENIVEFSFSVQHPRLWSAEAPELYILDIRLLDDGGNVLDRADTRIGFRRFEIENGVMKLNNKRIVFHGVNRHEFHRDRGRALTAQDIESDLMLLKRNNFNAVRTSHYPDQSVFYRLCDELGLYVIDETNLETHGTWGYSAQPDRSSILPDGNPLWREACLSRARAMLERDKNHPCVLIWSCGNESYGGSTLSDMADWFRGRDATRPVHYEGIQADMRYPDTSDIISRMYAKPAEVRKLLEEGVSKPVIMCEYAHAMGNSFGNIDEYSALEEEFEKYQGGFVWDFADQGIRAFTADGREYTACGGDFFDRPNDAYFCGNGLLFADRSPSPKLTDAKKLFEPVKLRCTAEGVEISNKNLFTDTANYYFEWTLMDDGLPVSSGRFTACAEAQRSVFVPLAIELPDQHGELVMECSARLGAAARWCEEGHEVAFAQTVLAPFEFPALNGAPDIVGGHELIGARFPKGDIILSCVRGCIHSLRSGGFELSTGDSFIDMWRAPTDNDLANGNAARWAAFCASARYAGRGRLTRNGDILRGEFEPFPGGRLMVEYKLFGEGIEVRAALAPVKGDVPLFGLGLPLRGELAHIAYYGDSRRESYPDRRDAQRLALVEDTVASQLVPYLDPQECANRGAVRLLRLTDANGRGLEITSDRPFSFSALPYTSHELENARHVEDLPRSNKTVLSLRSHMCGVAGDDSWGGPVHEPYIVRTDEGLTFDFRIKIL